jgi:hypothetical protein
VSHLEQDSTKQLKRQFVITEFESQDIRVVEICSVSFVLVARNNGTCICWCRLQKEPSSVASVLKCNESSKAQMIWNVSATLTVKQCALLRCGHEDCTLS